MAEAMIDGLTRAGIVRTSDVLASDVDRKRLAAVRREHGIRTTSDNLLVVRSASVLFVSVKPQQIADVLGQIAPAVTGKHLVLSIAAGVNLASLEKSLEKAMIVRVMPNMACLVSEGMNVFVMGRRTTRADRGVVRRLLESFGQVLELPERFFDAVTALSGSGPAFFAYCLDKMVCGAVREGMDRQSALLLASQTMLGTARLLKDRGVDPAELIAGVASAKGTTAAGLEILERSDTGKTLGNTIRAAAGRSRQLSRSVSG